MRSPTEGPGRRTAVHAGPTALAVKEARAVWLDTPDLAENVASTAGYAYQIGPSGDPENVVWTKTNAGDPSCSRRRLGGTRGFNNRYGILGSGGR